MRPVRLITKMIGMFFQFGCCFITHCFIDALWASGVNNMSAQAHRVSLC
jgi:hypothetical protein